MRYNTMGSDFGRTRRQRRSQVNSIVSIIDHLEKNIPKRIESPFERRLNEALKKSKMINS